MNKNSLVPCTYTLLLTLSEHFIFAKICIFCVLLEQSSCIVTVCNVILIHSLFVELSEQTVLHTLLKQYVNCMTLCSYYKGAHTHTYTCTATTPGSILKNWKSKSVPSKCTSLMEGNQHLMDMQCVYCQLECSRGVRDYWTCTCAI